MSERFAQGPYVAAIVGFKPNMRTQGTEPTTEPLMPHKDGKVIAELQGGVLCAISYHVVRSVVCKLHGNPQTIQNQYSADQSPQSNLKCQWC